MPTILKIGYQRFLIRDSQATAALKALAGAILLDHKYVGGAARELFWPDERHNTEIGLEVIKATQLRQCAPACSDDGEADEPIVTPPPKKILRLTSGE